MEKESDSWSIDAHGLGDFDEWPAVVMHGMRRMFFDPKYRSEIEALGAVRPDISLGAATRIPMKIDIHS